MTSVDNEGGMCLTRLWDWRTDMRSALVTTRLTGTVRGTARRPRFSPAIISVTVQLRIQVFWVRSVCFNVRNILPKSGTSPPPRHPIYKLHVGWSHKWTPWRSELLEKLNSPQLVKDFPALYGNRTFITALIRPFLPVRIPDQSSPTPMSLLEHQLQYYSPIYA